MLKWIIRLSLLLVVMTLATVAVINYQLSQMFGGHTEVANVEINLQSTERFAITNVNVLTPSADHFLNRQTVVIDGKSIASVGSVADLSGITRIIDADGMYLVPGFIDSHVHLWESENDLLLYVANGVTQVREMNGSSEHLRWKQEIQTGRLGPQLFVVAPQLASFELPGGWFTSWFQRKTNVRSTEALRDTVHDFKSAGYDAIKSSSFLDRDIYNSISELSEDHTLPLVGHIPHAVELDDVWRSAQIEIAHVEELMKALRDEFGGYSYDTAAEFLEFVRARSPEVADRVLENGLTVTSTISLIDSLQQQKSDLTSVLDSAQLKYANPGITEGVMITSRGMGWLPEVNIYRWPDQWDQQRREQSRIYWQTYSDAQHIVLSALLDKGVTILAGTDSNVPVTVPGFVLHDEMQALNAAGMSPAQVLASATTLPARFMGSRSGEIRPEYTANLVLLRDNPLQNIAATESIEMTIVNGRVLSRSDLDALLTAVLDANDQSRTVHPDV